MQKERIRIKAWTGYHVKDAIEEMVYVTSNGVVFHRNYNCTHLQLSINYVEYEQVELLRNQFGAKYHRCERCVTGTTLFGVYITKSGNRYHQSLSCSGLKRTIQRIDRNQRPWLHECTRCGIKGGAKG